MLWRQREVARLCREATAAVPPALYKPPARVKISIALAVPGRPDLVLLVAENSCVGIVHVPRRALCEALLPEN